jgi:hypothetical protein
MRTLSIVLLLAASAATGAETPLVSRLHTVSIHIDSPETYNTLLRFFEKDLKLPVIYGKPWTPDRQGRRSYAGIWAGNVVLELCGPYAGESFPDGVRARLHGLTFDSYQSVDESTRGLDRAGILHKAPFGDPDEGARFVVLDDPALTSPTLALSIMQEGEGQRAAPERSAARTAFGENRGGLLGLISVKEIRVAYRNSASLERWREFLAPDFGGTGEGPRLLFEEGGSGALTAIVLRVASPRDAAAFLQSIGSGKILTAGVKIVCVE